MKRIAIVIFLILLVAGCSKDYYSVKHVTSKNRNRYYNRKTDKGKKRIKYVNKKIVRQKGVAKSTKKVKPEEPVTHEQDTTGFIP